MIVSSSQGTNYRKTNAAMEMRLINRESFWARAEVSTPPLPSFLHSDTCLSAGHSECLNNYQRYQNKSQNTPTVFRQREEEERKDEERKRTLEERRRLEKERVLKERRDAEERDRKMNEKLQMIEEQRSQ